MKTVLNVCRTLWAVALVLALAIPSALGADTLISTGAVWKYLDTGSDEGTAWRTVDYDDSAWPGGTGKFGFGEGDEATVLNASTTNGQPIVTCYFRHSFVVQKPSAVGALTLRLLRDDGAVVYLNGTEIRRDNMRAGDNTYSTPASLQAGDTEERIYWAAQVSPAPLVHGENVLAVEVHQSSVSGDLGFNLELLAGSPTSLPLAEALDTTNLIWTTGGNLPWFGQTQSTRDGVDAAQSSHVPLGSSSWLETTVDGPGELRYAFQVRTEHTNSYFRLLLDGAAIHIYSLHLGWSGNGYTVPAGRHTLRWQLENPVNGGGSSVAWLDAVVYVRDPSSPTNPPPQICPCDGSWRNHGEFVGCVITHAWQLFRAGSITAEQRREMIRIAARSDCGKRGPEPVQVHILPLTPEERRRDGVQVLLSGEADSECVIESSSDLIHWLPMQPGSVTITGAEITFPPDAAPTRFFRARLLP